MRTATRHILRPMRPDDIAQVMEIERESFPSMWPPTAFKRELQQNRNAHYIVVVESDPGRRPLEAEPDQRPAGFSRLFGELWHILGSDNDGDLPPPEQRPELIVGFIGVWMLHDETHIVTIAVRETHRRRGVGELLLIAALDLAREHGQALITLECRVGNEAALSMYEKYGFQQVGLRPRYYSDNHEDAYVMTASSVLSDRYLALVERLRAEHRCRWGDFEIQHG